MCPIPRRKSTSRSSASASGSRSSLPTPPARALSSISAWLRFGRAFPTRGNGATSRRSLRWASACRRRRSRRTSGCSSTSTTPSSSRADMDAAWWADGGEPVTILGTEELWGESVATVVVPSTGRIDRVPASQLRPLGDRTWLRDEVVWRAATGLAWRAMAGGEPLAIARGRIDPLPHQLAVLDRAMATHPLRLLLADEVGLGKTIEAGLVITELKARGLVQRVLVVAPKGVQLQWVAEMADRFDEEVVLVGTGGIPLDMGVNPWRAFNQIVCSLDAVKPIRARTGWTPERVAAHNN